MLYRAGDARAIYTSGERHRAGANVSKLTNLLQKSVDCMAGAPGQTLPEGPAGAIRAGAQHDDFPAMLFREAQSSSRRAGVRPVNFEVKVLFFDPLTGSTDANHRVSHRNLFHGSDDFHGRFLEGSPAPAGKTVFARRK